LSDFDKERVGGVLKKSAGAILDHVHSKQRRGI
jgi:hypothetical protein